MGTRFYAANENAIEFLRDEDRMTVTFSDPHFIAVVKRLAKKYPDQVEIMALPSNNGGYIYAHLPVSFLRLQVPASAPTLTAEQKDELRERVATFKSNNSSRTAEGNE